MFFIRVVLWWPCQFLAIAANVGNIYYSSHASVGFAAELRKGMFNKIQKLSVSSIESLSSASWLHG